MDDKTNKQINDALVFAGTLATSDVTTGKDWYKSRTLWVNVLAVGFAIIQTQTGFVAAPELQMVALSVVNMILRQVTKEPLTW